MSEGQETACVVMAKWPVPGRVKTRLARSLGPEAAADLARAMLLDTVDRVRESGLAPSLALDAGGRPLPGEVEGVRTEPQEGDGLGERIAAAVQGRWREGHRRVIVLGTDSPDFPDAFLETAVLRMEEGAPSVLGPTADGGLYLLGFGAGEARPGALLRSALADLSWGTAGIFEEVCRALVPPLGPARLLEPWYDVDVPDDLVRLAGEIGDKESPRRLPVRVAAWLTGLAL